MLRSFGAIKPYMSYCSSMLEFSDAVVLGAPNLDRLCLGNWEVLRSNFGPSACSTYSLPLIYLPDPSILLCFSKYFFFMYHTYNNVVHAFGLQSYCTPPHPPKFWRPFITFLNVTSRLRLSFHSPIISLHLLVGNLSSVVRVRGLVLDTVCSLALFIYISHMDGIIQFVLLPFTSLNMTTSSSIQVITKC